MRNAEIIAYILQPQGRLIHTLLHCLHALRANSHALAKGFGGGGGGFGGGGGGGPFGGGGFSGGGSGFGTDTNSMEHLRRPLGGPTLCFTMAPHVLDHGMLLAPGNR